MTLSSLEAASKQLREANADLDALRQSASNCVSAREHVADKPENQPILDAWMIARERFRAAAKAYVEAYNVVK